MKVIQKIVRGITKAELWFSAATFGLMVVCYFISVVNRNIIKGSMPWTEELALYAMVYMALLGTELGLRDGTQVSVTAITSKLEGKTAGKILAIVSQVVLIIFTFMMLRYGIALVATQARAGQTTPVMKIPMFIMYLSLVIAFGLTLLTQVLMLICRILNIPMEPITNIDAMIDGILGKKEEDK